MAEWQVRCQSCLIMTRVPSRGVTIPALDPDPEPDLGPFWDSDSNSGSRLWKIWIHIRSGSTSGFGSGSTRRVRQLTNFWEISDILRKISLIGPNFSFEVDPDPELDPDLGMDSDLPWIRIQVILILALLEEIPAPDPDPQKSGIITPLVPSHFVRVTGQELFNCTLYSTYSRCAESE